MIEAKGRNGYFKVDRIKVTMLGAGLAAAAEVHVDILSARTKGGIGPARITGTPDEIRKLAKKLLSMVNREIESGGEIWNLEANLDSINRIDEEEK
jgi:hypothetical protein